MGGSFESGAGDDPDELFADDDEPEEESVEETESVADAGGEQDPQMNSTEDAGNSEAQTKDSVMLEVDTSDEMDAARLAREFVPDTYEKPHPWALGRNGVNDGRSEKKTFFLQSNVLNLEATCSQEVNEMLDGEVPLTDLRELALIIAYHQPELLAEAARVWGAESA